MIDTIAQGLSYSIFAEEIENSIDEIDMTNVIAFTWSPDPNKYSSNKCRDQYKSLLFHILLVSNKFFRVFCFVPEINKSGYVHIHGWYILKDKIGYYKSFLPKCRQIGFVVLKDKINREWFEYCKKDIDETIQIIGDDMPIPLTNINIKAYVNIWRKKSGLKYMPNKLPKVDIMRYFTKK